MENFLDATTPDLWTLDSFSDWCMRNEKLAGDKIKILDHMRKQLEARVENVFLSEETRNKAIELLGLLQVGKGSRLNWDRAVCKALGTVPKRHHKDVGLFNSFGPRSTLRGLFVSPVSNFSFAETLCAQ